MCKCKAHTKTQIKSNDSADAAAKAAAQAPIPTTMQMPNISSPITPLVSLAELVEVQQSAPTQK